MLKSMLFHRFFIIATCVIIIDSHRLGAMEQKLMATDLQIYQLFTGIEENNSTFCLPKELIQIIAHNAHDITVLRCYEKYGKCLTNADYLLSFIERQAKDNQDIESTVHIIKTCLKHTGQSLCNIYCDIYSFPAQMLHRAVHFSLDSPMVYDEKFLRRHKNKKCYCFEALCQIAGNDLMELLYSKDDYGYMPLTIVAFDICARLVWANKKITKENLERMDLLNWEAVPDYVKVILKYVDEDKRAQLILDSHKPKYDERMDLIEQKMHEDDSVD